MQAALGYPIAASGDGGGGGSGTMTSLALTTDVESPQPVGMTIQLSAAGSGGGPPYQYRFWVQPWGGEWAMVRDWSPVAVYSWSPTDAGGYNVSVEGRSDESTTAEALAMITFDATRQET